MLRNTNPQKSFDLSGEASKRRNGEEATSVAWQLENDDVNEGTEPGPVDSSNDGGVENKVWTLSADE